MKSHIQTTQISLERSIQKATHYRFLHLYSDDLLEDLECLQYWDVFGRHKWEFLVGRPKLHFKTGQDFLGIYSHLPQSPSLYMQLSHKPV